MNKADPELTNKLFQSMKVLCYGVPPRVILDSGQCAMMKLLRALAEDKQDKEFIRKMRAIRGKEFKGDKNG